jgi:hypothetical protein
MIFCRYNRDRLYQKLIGIYSRKGARNFDVYLVLTPNSFVSWLEFIYFFSRKGAKAAKNFNVYLVLALNIFAYFASC